MQFNEDPTHNRRRGLGGTDAKKIVEGDWITVYNEKMGLASPPDLSDIFPVQLGKHTEPFHRGWFTKRSGKELDLDSAKLVRVHPTRDFMFGHLDAWVSEDATFLEMKHTHGAASFRETAQYYMPQMAHYAAICGVQQCWFSIIPGNTEPVYGLVEITTDYMDALIEAELAFWWHVENAIPPEHPPAGIAANISKLSEAIKIDGLRAYDFTDKNQFTSLAGDWLLNRDAAKAFDKAVKELKELVPADAAEVIGVGITIKRDKANRLSIKERT